MAKKKGDYKATHKIKTKPYKPLQFLKHRNTSCWIDIDNQFQ